MRVLVTPDYRKLSQAAAELIGKALRKKPVLTLGLPTGNTPLGMYAELVKKYREERLDFSRVRTFNLDEYLGLPADDPNSYRAYMRHHLFDQVNIALENTRFPAVGMDYEKAIADAGGIDVLIVGIGANGHIAFNEPGSSLSSRTRVVDLAPETMAKARREFGSSAEPPHKAVTMGIATILDAEQIVLLASGRSKTQMVERALRGPVSESVPASALQLHANVIAILDEAARALKKK